MRSLTQRSEHGAGYSIDSGDVTQAITKLGKIEHKAFDLIEETCDGFCRYTAEYAGATDGQAQLEEKCADCPLEKLADMIWRG